jgi:hypothetical protein
LLTLLILVAMRRLHNWSEHVQASSPCFFVVTPEAYMVVADMVNLSSSDTEEAIDLWFLSPACDPCVSCFETPLKFR